MRIALDTNAYCEAARGESGAVDLLRRVDAIHLPFVVLAELRAGFSAGTRGRGNEARLIEFLNAPRSRALFADEQTTHHYARLFAQLRSSVTPIPTNDLWIAALTIQHDLVLFSRDRHFDTIPQLVRTSGR